MDPAIIMAIGTPDEFSEWSSVYDANVFTGDTFPFRSYRRVLQRVVDLADAGPGTSVLDLGIGTGNLARLFVDRGCQVLGVDYSTRMLDEAAKKLPDVSTVVADILGPWPSKLPQRYDRLVSAYVFHHFETDEKIDVLSRLKRDHLVDGGRIVIADLAFASMAALDAARVEWADVWDEELYWIVDHIVPAFAQAGLPLTFEPIDDFVGVFVLQ